MWAELRISDAWLVAGGWRHRRTPRGAVAAARDGANRQQSPSGARRDDRRPPPPPPPPPPEPERGLHGGSGVWLRDDDVVAGLASCPPSRPTSLFNPSSIIAVVVRVLTEAEKLGKSEKRLMSTA